MPAIDHEPWSRTHAEHRASLEENGYIEIPEHRGIKPGVRIHHRGQRYVKAYWHGTSTVIAVYEHPDSEWSRIYRSRDIEIIHQPDDAPDGECPITWADYHAAPKDAALSWCVLPDGHPGQCLDEVGQAELRRPAWTKRPQSSVPPLGWGPRRPVVACLGETGGGGRAQEQPRRGNAGATTEQLAKGLSHD